jgi:uncharacterized protein (TIGR02217 family)
MAFVDFPTPTPIFPVLPPLTWSVHKKFVSSSRAITAVTGRGVQVATAAYPRFQFTLSYGGDNSWLRDQTQNITPEPQLAGYNELAEIIGLYVACLGPYGEFYYTEPDDCSRLGAAVGAGDGTTTTFQLYVPWGSGPYTPAFYSPCTGINTINNVYFNGVVQSPTLYSVDATNTMLVFTTAPGSEVVITCDFSFYYRSRFMNDNLTTSQWAQNLWNVKEVQFESVKP